MWVSECCVFDHEPVCVCMYVCVHAMPADTCMCARLAKFVCVRACAAFSCARVSMHIPTHTIRLVALDLSMVVPSIQPPFPLLPSSSPHPTPHSITTTTTEPQNDCSYYHYHHHAPAFPATPDSLHQMALQLQLARRVGLSMTWHGTFLYSACDTLDVLCAFCDSRE